MGRINIGRVILGGLVAGLVINLGEYILNELVMKSQWDAVMAGYNLPTAGGSTIVWFMLFGLLQGTIVVWLYAAMRPRLGAGAGTAVKAGLVMWSLAWFISLMYPFLLGLIPSNIVWTTIIWGLVEVPLAAVIGAWLYREA